MVDGSIPSRLKRRPSRVMRNELPTISSDRLANRASSEITSRCMGPFH